LRLAGGRAGGAADGEARRGSPERHRGADEGGRCLQGSPGETSDGGRGCGDSALAVAKATAPPGAATMAVEWLTRRALWQPRPRAPPGSSCCGCPGGGRASGAPVASPLGP
jgi:hypothetical protein